MRKVKSERFIIFPLAHSTAEAYVRKLRLSVSVVHTLKRYSKALEYEYKVKTATLGTLKRYSIFSLTLYLE
jgi:hypothetical protein